MKATVSSTSFWRFLACQLKQNQSRCVWWSPDSVSPQRGTFDHVYIRTWKECLLIIQKTISRTFLEKCEQRITLKSSGNYYRTTKLSVVTSSFIFCWATLLTSRNSLIRSVTSKVNDSTRIWRSWKNWIRVDEMVDSCWSKKRFFLLRIFIHLVFFFRWFYKR